VTVDATITRLVLLPAMMQLLGDWNWWMPGRAHSLPPVGRVGEGVFREGDLAS
jgi:RND superfamily putative drug exporter